VVLCLPMRVANASQPLVCITQARRIHLLVYVAMLAWLLSDRLVCYCLQVLQALACISGTAECKGQRRLLVVPSESIHPGYTSAWAVTNTNGGSHWVQPGSVGCLVRHHQRWHSVELLLMACKAAHRWQDYRVTAVEAKWHVHPCLMAQTEMGWLCVAARGPCQQHTGEPGQDVSWVVAGCGIFRDRGTGTHGCQLCCTPDCVY
jgi:hypothetical protein